MLRWLRDRWRKDLAILRERRERRMRDRKILCPHCGYDVTVPTGPRCPECGLEQDPGWREGWFTAGSRARVATWFACCAILGSIAAIVVTFAAVMLSAFVWLTAAERGIIPEGLAKWLTIICTLVPKWAVMLLTLWIALRWKHRWVYGGSQHRLLWFAAVTAVVLTIAVVAWNLKPWH